MKASGVGLVLAITKVLERLGSFVLIVAAARLLTQTDFGFFRIVSMYAILAVSIVTFGLPAGHLYFLAKVAPADRKKHASAVQFLLTGIGFLIGVIGAGVTYGFAWQAGLLERITATGFFFLYCVAATPAAGLPNLLVAINRARRASVLSIVASMSEIAITLTLAIATRESWGLLVGLGIGALFHYVILLTGIRRVLWIPLLPIVDRYTLRSVWQYTYPLGLSNAINFVSRRLDAVIVTLAASTQVFGIYSVGTIEVPVVPVLAGAALGALVPNLSCFLVDGKLDNARDLWHRGIVKLATVIIPVAAATFIFAEELIVLLFGEEFREAVVPLRCYSIVTASRFMLVGPFLAAGGHTTRQLQMSFSAVLTTAIVASLFAFSGFPLWAGVGAASGVIMAGIVGLNAVHRIYQYSFNEILPWRRLGELLFVSVIILGLGRSAVGQFASPLMRLGIGLGGSGILIAMMLHTRGYMTLTWLRGVLRAALAKD